MQYIENYTDQTKEKFKLLLLAETPSGFLTYLKALLRAIEEDNVSKNKFKRLVDEIHKENDEVLKIKERLISWMSKKLTEMRSEKAAKHDEVKQTLDRFERGTCLVSGK